MKERLPDWVQGWLDTIMPIGQVLLILLAAWLVQRLVRLLVRRLVDRRGLPLEMAVVLRRLSASLIAAAALLLVLVAVNALRRMAVRRNAPPPSIPADAGAFPIPPLPGARTAKEKADA